MGRVAKESQGEPASQRGKAAGGKGNKRSRASEEDPEPQSQLLSQSQGSAKKNGRVEALNETDESQMVSRILHLLLAREQLKLPTSRKNVADLLKATGGDGSLPVVRHLMEVVEGKLKHVFGFKVEEKMKADLVADADAQSQAACSQVSKDKDPVYILLNILSVPTGGEGEGGGSGRGGRGEGGAGGEGEGGGHARRQSARGASRRGEPGGEGGEGGEGGAPPLDLDMEVEEEEEALEAARIDALAIQGPAGPGGYGLAMMAMGAVLMEGCKIEEKLIIERMGLFVTVDNGAPPASVLIKDLLEQNYLAKVTEKDDEGHPLTFYTLGVRAEAEVGREKIGSYLEHVFDEKMDAMCRNKIFPTAADDADDQDD